MEWSVMVPAGVATGTCSWLGRAMAAWAVLEPLGPLSSSLIQGTRAVHTRAAQSLRSAGAGPADLPASKRAHEHIGSSEQGAAPRAEQRVQLLAVYTGRQQVRLRDSSAVSRSSSVC